MVETIGIEPTTYRTDYLLNAIQALSQVSYAPIGTSQPWLRL